MSDGALQHRVREREMRGFNKQPYVAQCHL